MDRYPIQTLKLRPYVLLFLKGLSKNITQCNVFTQAWENFNKKIVPQHCGFRDLRFHTREVLKDTLSCRGSHSFALISFQALASAKII